MRPERRTFPTRAAKKAADTAVVMEAEVDVAAAGEAVAEEAVDVAARMLVVRNRTSAAGKPS